MLKPTILPMEGPSIRLASQVVRSGGVVVFPTDTVYGLGCNPADSLAVDRLCAVKRRETKPIPILCDSIETARSVARLNERGSRLAEAHWPGALTIVAPLRISLPFPIDRGSGMVGVRVPAHELCVTLLKSVGGLLTGTSANVSGRPSCRSAEQAARSFANLIDLVLDGGYLAGRESTVIQLEGESVHVLREGSVRVSDAGRDK
jgi:L-threonylcarbamoyladenylate synthase